ncbi:hypothetical protein HanOQP8_Chr15g0564941 [Helianthus annuus]|nr:hypothetical protein HanOQP8_Chr15g0564941 [Helianthus annuus]
MEAIERAKFGINDRQMSPSNLTKELGKMFPWMPTFKSRNDGSPSLGGYQTLS